MAKRIPVVGLAGRRNAGKSSLFNALLGKNRALTHETPGLTRDILRGEVNRYGMRFHVLDLPGLDLEPEHGLDDAILARARESLNTVDLLVYLMEPPAAAPFDIDFIEWLRKENRPLILAVNKIDAPEKESEVYGFYEDGLDPMPVSAASKYHLKDLCEAIKDNLESRGIRVPPAAEKDPSQFKSEPPWKRKKKASAGSEKEDLADSANAEPSDAPNLAADSHDVGDDVGDLDSRDSLEVVYVAGHSRSDDEVEDAEGPEEDDFYNADEPLLETMEESSSSLSRSRTGNAGAGDLTEAEIEDIWQKRQRSKEARSTTISDDRSSDLRISLVGKQNAGKSSLFNRLVNEELSLVSDIAGTTRDTLDTVFRYQGKAIRIIDTAGLKKRGAVKNSTDFYSMRRTLRAMQDSEVVIHLIDGLKGISDYDKKIQAMIARFARPCVLVVNKWDAVPDKDHKTQKNFLLDLKAAFRFLENVPVLFSSALTGKNTLKILAEALSLKEKSAFRVSTSQLNGRIKVWFRDWPGKNAGFRILYATQPDANPPVFLFFINDKTKMQKGFPRFIENKIRQDFHLQGVPIRVFFRERSG
tara:strand:- start:140616 stop:142370 length:1755 start_codon:yes stop_codon:yes gene_type:complete